MNVVKQAERPYRHWTVADAVPAAVLCAAAAAPLPAATHPGWVRYDNPNERLKWTMTDLDALGPAWQALYAALHAPAFVAALAELAGIPGLFADAMHHGAGCHVMFPGGYLHDHVDSALHPLGWERRVNVVLSLTSGAGRPGDGGGTALSDWDGGRVVVAPEFGQALIWACGDDTIHGVAPLTPLAPPRVTAAAYYWTAPRPGATRRRAMFLPRR